MKVPDELIDACAGGNCLLVGGSGIDGSAGGATWTDFVREVLADGRRSNPERAWDTVLSDLESGRHASVADAISLWLTRDGLQATAWAGAPTATTSPLIQALGSIPFAGAISLSWHDLLETAFAHRGAEPLEPGDVERLPTLLRDDRFAILHPWGRLATGDVLFTASELRATLFDNDTLLRTLSSLFGSRTWLFVGASVHAITELLVSALPKGSAGHHYAVVTGEASAALDVERLRESYGVRVIVLNSGSEVADFVVALSQSVRSSPKKPERGQQLKRLYLSNIGPFHQASFQLDAAWTVLLGDNGSGKSSVLKAIALALCGDDARIQRLGPQLLREGANEGSIELEIGDDVLRTVLTRVGQRVHVAAKGVSPVQAGTVLALGFPPIRGVTTGDPSDIRQPSALGPEAEDLIPLLLGPVDQRLDDLKQWVVDVSASSDGDVLIGRLFDAVLATTPNLKYVFDSVDSNRRVIVRTSDGLLPFERLSQGVVSVLGWIGTIIRRLEESKNSHDGAPEATVVVLLDEIDAHLHPDWQRQITQMVRAALPNVQVVATTHSPLVVGAVGDGAVIHVERRDGIPTPQVLSADFEGWRADQVLTGPAFGLRSTRAPQVSASLSRLRDLTALRERSEQQDDELDDLQRRLHAVLPSPLEDPLDRVASDILQDAARALLADQPEDERAELLDRLRTMIRGDT